ncbi:hypothetical protein LTR36_005323 [Oleoguttula mirabilis]|uniref:N-acetyltransferase domain-containing protein n=1 Tax=Oleoguttula mirabilis TaxID=1507867 RepID=A0AAV9JEM1_9PEZI|nr:hypothetical protein LTR36_005323 [Oleoguttula mirabilis]
MEGQNQVKKEGQHKPAFTIRALPKLPVCPESDSYAIALAHKFRDIRLQSLKFAPEAFASSYEIESQRGIDHTLQRLSNPKADVIVAISSGSAVGGGHANVDELQQLLQADWVGFTGLLGPETEQTLSVVSAKRDPWAKVTAATSTDTATGATAAPVTMSDGGDVKTLHYHIGGVFVSPSARHSGLGKAMIATAVAKAEAEARRAHASMRCSVLVKPENTAARGLYAKAGFVVVGEETYVQPPRSLVPGESQTEKMVALRMELHRAVSQM